MSGVVPSHPAPVPDRVDSGPAGTRFGEVRRFAQLDSTNRYLLDVARHQPREGVVVLAEYQSAGRGRMGRRWEAPAGANLLMSVLLVPTLDLDQLQLCSVAAALATAEACRQVAALDPELKWPNDLVVGGRKLAGILAETLPVTSQVARRAVVVGIGLNVAWPPPESAEGPPTGAEAVPGDHGAGTDDLMRSATSIRRETGTAVDHRLLLEVLLVDLERRLRRLEDGDGPARLVTDYRRRCATIGQVVQVVMADGEIRGEAVDVTPEGHLVVDVGTGLTTVSAGDVVHLYRG